MSGGLDVIRDAAEYAARVDACDRMAAVASSHWFNPGQEIMMHGYVLPAMQTAVMSGERQDGISGAGYDSHWAAEQALSETIEEMTAAAEYILEIIDSSYVLEIFDLL